MEESLIVDGDIEEICQKLNDIKNFFEGKSIVLTGAGGFLGRYFMAVFKKLNSNYLSNPCMVYAYDNFITDKDKAYSFENESIKFKCQDICQGIEIDENIDYVIHAAGIASPYYYRALPLHTIDVSVVGTRKMLDFSKEKGARFLFFSSSEIYGDPDPKYIPTPESYRGNVSCLGSRACYDESKRLGETLCRIYATEKHIHTNIVRPFNIYGPGMGENDYRVLPNFASNIKANKPLKIYGSGKQTRTFCYITDAIYGFLTVLIRGVSGEPYNIGNPTPEISMLDLATMFQMMTGKNIQINVIDYPDSYPADEPDRRCPDITKAAHQLKYQPTIRLEEGLRRFLTWTDQCYVGK